jgi:Flp pilus assembly protein CpaB
VIPEEAEKLSLAYQEGPIVLALRGVGDETEPKTIGSNKNDLLALGARKTTGPARVRSVAEQGPDKYKVEVIHGTNRNVVEF